MKQIIEKFRIGIQVSDSELKMLLHHYERLVFLLNEHDDRYFLVKKDAENEFDRAKNMYFARFNRVWSWSPLRKKQLNNS